MIQIGEKPLYYAVKKGRLPGIYTEWEDCLIQVKNYKDCSYQAFDNINSAYLFLCGCKNLTRYKYSSKKALICNNNNKCLLIEQEKVTNFENNNAFIEAINEAIKRGIPALDIHIPDDYADKASIMRHIEAVSLKIKIDIM